MILIVGVRPWRVEVLQKAPSQCLRPKSWVGVVHGVDIPYLRVVFDTERVDHACKRLKSVSDSKGIQNDQTVVVPGVGDESGGLPSKW